MATREKRRMADLVESIMANFRISNSSISSLISVLELNRLESEVGNQAARSSILTNSAIY